jgi:drug/metabolite transporter (DMT)-like permease
VLGETLPARGIIGCALMLGGILTAQLLKTGGGISASRDAREAC